MDAFAGGRLLDTAGCEDLFRQSQGPQAEFTPELLAPVDNVAIINRMLANLLMIGRSRNDRDQLCWVLGLRVHLPGAPLAERAELAQVLSSAGRLIDAAEQWEIVAARSQGRASAEATSRASQLRAMLN